MTAEHAQYYISTEEYLAGERISQQRHEYLAGIIYARLARRSSTAGS